MPWKILKEMDRSGGTLSYAGIEVLRSVETKGKKRVRGCVLPSSAELKPYAKKIETFAHSICPFELTCSSKFGEMLKFDYKNTFQSVLGAFQLIFVGQNRLLLVSESIDGAQLSMNLHHVTGGFKITDRCAVCPITGHLILGNGDELCAQSRDLVFPMQMLMHRETEESFQAFKPMFDFFEDCSKDETNPLDHGIWPVMLCATCDLSAQWKGLCKGGAAKVANLPCHCCPLGKNKWATPNTSLCSTWCQQIHADIPVWQCYHHDMCSDDNLDAMADEVEELTNALKVSLDVIQQGTKMPFGEDPVTPAANASSDPYSIHFIPADSATKHSYSQLLNYELKLRNLSVLGTFTERRERLRNELQSEKKLRELLVRLNHSKRDANALFLLIQTLPCILHMENRMGIKIITMLFVKGLSSAMKKELYGDVPSEASRIDKYFETIQSIVNKNILGSELSPAHWKCPTAAKGKEIGTITMDNGKTRKIIDSLELLIDASIVDNAEKTQWKECIPFYRSAVTRLRPKEDFDTEAIVRFQQDADKFFQTWVTLHGIEGITNYIHMLSSGHMSVCALEEFVPLLTAGMGSV